MEKLLSTFPVLFLLLSLFLTHQTFAGKNIVPNSSFEKITGDIPKEWRWQPARANGTLTIDSQLAHSGNNSIKIVNNAPRAPHIYSYISITLHVKPNTTYTISCYTRSEDPGAAWIGGGKGWNIRKMLPKTGDKWVRVSTTITTAPDEEEFRLMILSESPTKGFWIDDVKMEKGEVATPYIFKAKLPPGKTSITIAQGDDVDLNENMVENSSFEIIDGNRPRSWMWDKRNTDATLTIDSKIARTGSNSIKLTNGTHFGPHVYGHFSVIGGIPVEPNRTYTISCYVRSEDPGIAWIGGGKGWTIREHFPQTGKEWVRVVRTFKTQPDEKIFPLMILTESPTPGIWIDDVKMEEGYEATYYLPESMKATLDASLELELGLKSEAFVHDEFSCYAFAYTPQPIPNAKIHFRLEDQSGNILASAETQKSLNEGIAKIDFAWGVGNQSDTLCRLTFSLHDAAGKTLLTKEAEFKLFTRYGLEQNLTRSRESLRSLNALIAEAEDKGIDSSYPKVTATVVENFIQYARDDYENNKGNRAMRVADYIARSCENAIAEIKRILAHPNEALTVPRYKTGEIVINDGAFYVAGRPMIFTGVGHFGQVRRDVPKLPGYGQNIIQIEFGPNSVLPNENDYADDAINNFLHVLEKAAANNVAVNLLLSPHYFPSWAMKKYPHLKQCGKGFVKYCIEAPESRAILEKSLRYVIPKIAGKPGLHSYCLSNEPIYSDSCIYTRKKWHKWLADKHGTIQRLNELYSSAYKSFEDVPIPEDNSIRGLWYDWCVFNQWRHAGWHAWMKSIIREYDPKTPVHAKIMATIFNPRTISWGVDPEQFCELSDINGCDCCIFKTGSASEWAVDWQTQNMFYDLMRSMQPAQPVFNSENHIIRDNDASFYSSSHIRTALWQGAIHGQGATTIWVWERGESGSSLKENILTRPNCVEAAGRTALDLVRLAPYVTALANIHSEVALLYSISSIVHDGPTYLGELRRAYQGLNFTGVKIDFISENQIAQGKLSHYKLLIVPKANYVKNSTWEGIVRFISGGGRLIAVNDSPLFDEYARSRAKTLKELAAATKIAPRAILAGSVKDVIRLAKSPKVRWIMLTESPEARDYCRLFDTLLDGIGLTRSLHAVDEDGKPAWGIETRCTSINGKDIINLVNLTRKPKTIFIKSVRRIASIRNLITDSPIEVSSTRTGLTLHSLSPVLLEVAH